MIGRARHAAAFPGFSAASLVVAGAAVLAALGSCTRASDSIMGGDAGTTPDGGTDAGHLDGGGQAGASGTGNAGRNGAGGRAGSAGAGGSAGPAGGKGGHSAGAGGSSAGAGGAQGTCFVTVDVRSPVLTSNSIEVGPDVRVCLQGTVFNSKSTAPKLTWSITSAASGALMTTLESGCDGANEVSFPATTTGNYQIVAQVMKEPECTSFTRVITGVRSSPAFNVRVTASGFPVTVKRIGPPISELPVSLDPGSPFVIEPHANPSAPGQPTVMPAYVRISSPQSGLSIEGSTSHGALPARLFPDQVYDLLIVPDDPSYAPDLFTATPSALAVALMVDPGTPVTGLVLGPDGAPLEGARMLLKRGSRPSTIGFSDASGTLTLRTRPGVMSAIVLPPPGSGLPQATVTATASGSGLNLAAATSALSITAKFQPIAQGTLTLTILDPTGATPVNGARVRIASQADPQGAPAAILTASAPDAAETQQLTAFGSVNAEVLSDAAGRASFGRLPTGKYDVLVVPPVGAGPQALTSLALELQTAGVVPSAAATITMATKVTLSGTLMPPTEAAGASITAVDAGADGSGGVASAVVDAKGGFTLAISPKRSYRIIVQPLPGSGRMRTVFAVDDVGVDKNGNPMPPVPLALTLQRGRSLVGTVENAGFPIGQAFIQVFCVSSVPSCVDPTISLAEATTRGDGSFDLLIPDTDTPP